MKNKIDIYKNINLQGVATSGQRSITRFQKLLSIAIALSMGLGVKFFLIVFACVVLLWSTSGRSSTFIHRMFISIISMLPALLVLTILLCITIINSISSPYTMFEVRDIIITIVTICILSSVAKNNNAKNYLITSFEVSLCIISIIKIIVIIYSINRGIPVFNIVKEVSEFMGWSLQSYTTSISYIARIQIPFDCVIPFVLFFTTSKFLSKERSKKRSLIIFLLILISLLLSMSRAFWAMSIALVLLSILINANIEKIIFLALASVLFFGVIYSLSSDAINEIVS
ncbi:hypothetical protein, partial [Pluralibacter gergoviae]|uniref:hypothetical protein n=1 Tax=Pluralibacter gergoviae TaxID=61647 RepID=UPI000B02B9FA